MLSKIITFFFVGFCSLLTVLYTVAILSLGVKIYDPNASDPPDWMIFIMYGIAINGVAFTILTFVKERRDRKKEEANGFSY